MERLDTITRRVLADLRDRMEERAGEARNLPSEVAEVWGGGDAPRLARGDAHPRSPIRRIAKYAHTANVKREMP